jgi:glutathione synthase/RimK-type ligase-like ATP-grasp enzyme
MHGLPCRCLVYLQKAQHPVMGRCGPSVLRAISALWVNYPDAIREASYKPRQLSVAQMFGLEIPRTLITNDPDHFKLFYEQCHGKVIYKLLGFPLYRDEADQPVSTYTSLVSPEMLDQAHRVKATTHLFQEYIEKQCDLRIILIGKQVFAVEIHPLSEETCIDFRRDYGALRYAVHLYADARA